MRKNYRVLKASKRTGVQRNKHYHFETIHMYGRDFRMLVRTRDGAVKIKFAGAE